MMSAWPEKTQLLRRSQQKRQQRRRQRRHTRAAPTATPNRHAPSPRGPQPPTYAHTYEQRATNSRSLRNRNHMRMRRSVRQDEAPWKLTAQSAEAAAPPATSTSLLLHHIKYIFCLITTAAAWSGGGAGGRGCPRTSRTPKKMYYVYVYTKYICIHMHAAFRSAGRSSLEADRAVGRGSGAASDVDVLTPSSYKIYILPYHNSSCVERGRGGRERMSSHVTYTEKNVLCICVYEIHLHTHA